MNQSFFTQRVAGGVLALAALAACSDNTTTTSNAPSDKVDYALQVSSLAAEPGERIAVRVSASSRRDLMGLQGALSYDHGALAYVGQSQDGGMIVNVAERADGDLGVIAVNHRGLDDAGVLVFEVKRKAYLSGLHYELSKAAEVRTAESVTVGENHGVQLSASLVLPSSPRMMDLNAWNEELSERSGRKIPVALAPGEIPASGILAYGDANLDGSVDIFDISAALNVANNVQELIIGTNVSPTIRDMVLAANVAPANLPGFGEGSDAVPPGLEPDGTRVLDIFDISAILNDANGINDPIVGVNIPGRTGLITRTDVPVTANITTNTTWTSGNRYILEQQVYVTNGATLTIEPGTVVAGRTVTTGQSPALVISRDGRINASGTAAQPILFTCTNPTSFVAGSRGCWGGVIVLGNAQLNGFSATGQDQGLTDATIAGRTTTTGCIEASAEGVATAGLNVYGGCNDADNSGVLRYIIIENSGRAVTTDAELNSLGLAGVGYGTVVEYVQILNGSDDGVEIWGGAVDVRYVLIDGAEDDSFDISEGWGGRAQFVAIRQKEAFGDQCIEADNDPLNTSETAPRGTYGVLWNFTCLGENAPGDATWNSTNDRSDGEIRFRRGNKSLYGNFYLEGAEYVFGVDAGQEAVTCGSAAQGFNAEFQSIRYARIRQEWEVGAPASCPQAVSTAESQSDNLRAGWVSVVASPNWQANAVMTDLRPRSGRLASCSTPTSRALVNGTASAGIPGGPTVNADGRATSWFSINAAANFCGAVDPEKIPFYSGWTKASTNSYPTT
jgi:hypothetical protein